MKALLKKWKNVFARNPKSPRVIQTAEHCIILLDERPIRHRPIRIAPVEEAEISRQIDEMLENDINEPSNSPWGSRIILVKKKDGSLRFAVDYRDLYDASKKDAHPMPDARYIFDRMGGSAIFSKLDAVASISVAYL